MTRRKNIFIGMGIALLVYAIAATLLYLTNSEGASIQEFFGRSNVQRTLVPVFTFASIPNVFIFMFFIRQNWVARARGIITVFIFMLAIIAYLKFSV